MEQADSISFSVTYRRDEYLAIVEEHAIATVNPDTAAKLQSGLNRAVLTVFGSVMFAYKSLRVGTCTFVINPLTITRHSKGGELVVPWSDVTAVYKYKVGYIIAKKNGAMPIPYRVLSQKQNDMLATWAGPHCHAPDAT